ncbi:signal peptidase I [Enterococcus sp. RIT-PI-f]|uniref:signal peptidase I n=1 Tax=Enterococcus sp. RIT-PI-f TaxID=1690244 RepID=UPI0035653865
MWGFLNSLKNKLIDLFLITVVIFGLLGNFVPLPISFYSVLTGSMTPTIGIGNLVCIAKSTNYSEKEIIAYRSHKENVIHRIVEKKKDSEGEYYITKGDANNECDSQVVRKRQIKGKVICSIPFLGKIKQIIQTKFGMLAILCTSIQLWLLLKILRVFKEKNS